MTLRVNIEEFLCDYNGVLSLEDMSFILNFLNLVDVLENKVVLESKYGEHFNDCPWSEDSCKAGPDTCQCFIYNFKKQIVMDLIERYTKHFNIE